MKTEKKSKKEAEPHFKAMRGSEGYYYPSSLPKKERRAQELWRTGEKDSQGEKEKISVERVFHLLSEDRKRRRVSDPTRPRRQATTTTRGKWDGDIPEEPREKKPFLKEEKKTVPNGTTNPSRLSSLNKKKTSGACVRREKHRGEKERRWGVG